MKYFFTTITAFSIVILGYWLGGGNFERSVDLRSTYVLAICFSVIANVLAIIHTVWQKDITNKEINYEGL